MAEQTFTAATETTRHWTDEQDGTRVFRMNDELISRSLLDWSEPVRMKLEVRDDGTYDLICRTVT